MNKEPIHRFYGTPVSEWIKLVPNELDIDAVGLWQIIPTGRKDFGLKDQELIDFTKKILLGLFAKGAVPVIGAVGYKDRDWLPQEEYGNTPEEMANAIIAEWLKSGKDPDVGGLWFARPEMF